jgi:hypothetical protein
MKVSVDAWIRLRNTRRIALLARFEAALPNILAALERGEPLVELAGTAETTNQYT